VKIHTLWLSASVLALAWAGGASAQGISTPPARDANDRGSSSSVKEVVVTAERRTQNLQQTAIAATVLNQQDLLKNGITTIDQLQFISPSLTVNNFGQGNNVDIRGIGKGEHNTQTGTGVVTYRDGVPSFPGYFQEEPYYDVANVEVLRGPQGTFSGQNATGGAVIVSTRDATIGGGHDGYVFAHYGNYNDVGVQGAVSLPISDTFAARVAFNTQYRDTFYNLTGVTGNPNIRWGSARISLLWRPSQSFEVSFKTDYNYLNNGGYFGDALINPLTGLPNGTQHLFDIDNNFRTYAVDQFHRSVLKIDYTTASGVRFQSVSGYQRGQTAWTGDIDGTNLAAPNYIIDERANETLWSQELNIISPDNKPITWILGGYYDHNKYDFPPIFDIGVPPGVFDEDLQGVNTTHTLAAFGQVSLNLPSGLQLQGGLRYSKWSTTNHVLYFVPEYAPFFNQQQDETFTGDNLTGKVALNWKVNPDNFLYAFVATGAKPGGLNTSVYAFPQQPIPSPFTQEYVTDYEIGWKARLFDGHLRTQIGGFYDTFKNFQVIIPLPNNPRLATEQNDPLLTKLYGVEASAQAVLGDLSVNANVALQHSSLGAFYTQDPRVGVGGVCDPRAGPATTTCINLGGHPQTYAPDFTLNFQAQYDVHLGDGNVITPAVTFSHISGQWGTLFDNLSKNDHLDPRDILGASLAWTHGSFTATLYGYNLTNQHYVSALLSPIRIAGAPRQFGISLYKSF